MVRKQANPLVRFNFDSLTDTITNLAGTLILVVVLVMGIAGHVRREGMGPTAGGHTVEALQQQLLLLQQQTQEIDRRIGDLAQQWSAVQSRAGAMPQRPASPPATTRPPASPLSPPAPTPRPPAKPTPPGGTLPGTSLQAGPLDAPALPLLCALHLVAAAPASPPAAPTIDAAFAAEARRRAIVQQFDTAASAVRQAIEGHTARLAALRQPIEALRSQLARTPPPPAPPPAKGKRNGEAKKPPEKLTYVPPIEKFTTKVPIRFICQDRRVSVFPLDAIVGERLRAFVASERIGEGRSKSFEFDFPESDFLVRGIADKIVARFEAARKPGRLGETADEIRRPGSLFREALEASPGCSPKTHCVFFYVWPDSFDVYRKARSLVWETRVGGAQYSDGWKAMLPAEPIRFVRQPGRRATAIQDH